MIEEPNTEGPQNDPATAATLLVDELVTALINSRIYHLEHPRLQNSLEYVIELLGDLTAQLRSDRIRFACSERTVFFDGKPLLGASIAAARLIELVDYWNAGGIELVVSLSVEELATFFSCLIEKKQEEGESHEQLNARAAERHCVHCRLLPLAVFNEAAGVSVEESELRESYQTLMGVLQHVTVSLCRGGTIDFDPVLTGAEEIIAHVEKNQSALLGLVRQEQYDSFTFGHSIRVAILAVNFTRALTDDREVQLRVGAAALLHDVGKSLIPFEILHSRKALTREEFEVMSHHSELGARCLLDHHDSDPLAIAAAFGHHRGPDGSGYPETVHDHPLSWIVSIVKICDVYEALTAARPYKHPMTPVRAYRVMLAMGDKLDRPLLHRFIEVNGIFPVGQLVQLSTGEAAEVREQTDDLEHPIVKMIQDEDGSPAPDDELLDLREIACPGARAILSELVEMPSTEPSTSS